MTTNLVYVNGGKKFVYPVAVATCIGELSDYIGAENMAFPGSFAEIARDSELPCYRVHVHFKERIGGDEFFRRCDAFVVSRLSRRQQDVHLL